MIVPELKSKQRSPSGSGGITIFAVVDVHLVDILSPPVLQHFQLDKVQLWLKAVEFVTL